MTELSCEHNDYDDYFDRCPDCGIADLQALQETIDNALAAYLTAIGVPEDRREHLDYSAFNEEIINLTKEGLK
jgi:hypothetical protein